MTLLAAYSFAEPGSTVVDYSGNGRHFSLTGTNGVKDAAGHTNNALTKNGATMPILPMMGQTPNRTVMLWAKGTGGVWYIRWQVDSISSGAWGILNLSGTLGIQARNTTTLARPTTPMPSDGNWHNYTGTYDGTTVRLYLDATLTAQTALTGPLRTDADRIDIAEWTTNTTLIDDIRIYDHTLTTTEITDTMNTPVDSRTTPFFHTA